MSLGDKLDEKYDLGNKAVLVQIKCTSTSPFTVRISGGSTDVAAKVIAGQSFSVNDYGLAFWSPPSAPICFKTT